MSEHRWTLALGFERGASLIDSPTLHLFSQTMKIDNEEYIDIYDFVAYNMTYIEKRNENIVYSISLINNAFDKCTKLWYTKGQIMKTYCELFSRLLEALL